MLANKKVEHLSQEKLDRLRAYHLGIAYETFVARRAELERQAKEIRKSEKLSS